MTKFDWRMVESRVIEVISALVKLFDPHLLSRSEERDFLVEVHWSVRKASLFVAGISLACGDGLCDLSLVFGQ